MRPNDRQERNTMALNRALVVDDSRSARVALKKLLQEHDLDVAMAESGEAALAWLKDNRVDVIFMDHTMPGMDGLEAVAAIKANPDTATIPVMMYTTREGEVYVGQARALGAVGVMPKNVQPHELFDMLKSLGLVKDRREVAREDEQRSLDTLAKHEADTSPGQGMALESLVSRMLEDQHLTLRSDILRSQRGFAKQVAREIVLEQARVEEALADFEAPEASDAGGRSAWRSLAIAAAVVGITVAGFLGVQFKGERDAALQSLADVEARLSNENQAQLASLLSERDGLADGQDEMRWRVYDALNWAMRENNEVGYADYAFSERLADKVGTLLEHLEALGFNGEVRLTSHLGEFCRTRDATQRLELAASDIAASACDDTGHPLALSTRISERLSVPFSRLMRDYAQGPVRVELIALDASESEPRYDYPVGVSTAGAWNRIAALNNRVEIELRPAGTVPVPEPVVERALRISTATAPASP